MPLIDSPCLNMTDGSFGMKYELVDQCLSIGMFVHMIIWDIVPSSLTIQNINPQSSPPGEYLNNAIKTNDVDLYVQTAR